MTTAADSGALFWFYGWHLIDALPTSPLSTLKVKAPYDYDQTLVGFLLLTYTLLVVTPFLNLAKELVARRRNPTAPVSQPNQGPTNGTDDRSLPTDGSADAMSA